jgi:hypothetical protein
MTEFKNVGEIYSWLDKTRNKVVETVSILNEEQAGFRPSEDKWSASLLVEHLAKTEANLVRVVGKLLGKAEAENVPSDGNINPPFSFAEIAERWQGMRFEAPAFIVPEGATDIAESLKLLAESRRALAKLRPRIEAVNGSNAKYPHPAFGPLDLYQWLGFIGLHEMHHLRQIENLLAVQNNSN